MINLWPACFIGEIATQTLTLRLIVWIFTDTFSFTVSRSCVGILFTLGFYSVFVSQVDNLCSGVKSIFTLGMLRIFRLCLCTTVPGCQKLTLKIFLHREILVKEPLCSVLTLALINKYFLSSQKNWDRREGEKMPTKESNCVIWITKLIYCGVFWPERQSPCQARLCDVIGSVSTWSHEPLRAAQHFMCLLCV